MKKITTEKSETCFKCQGHIPVGAQAGALESVSGVVCRNCIGEHQGTDSDAVRMLIALLADVAATRSQSATATAPEAPPEAGSNKESKTCETTCENCGRGGDMYHSVFATDIPVCKKCVDRAWESGDITGVKMAESIRDRRRRAALRRIILGH